MGQGEQKAEQVMGQGAESKAANGAGGTGLDTESRAMDGEGGRKQSSRWGEGTQGYKPRAEQPMGQGAGICGTQGEHRANFQPTPR